MKHGPICFFIQGNRSWHIVFITNVAGPGDLILVYIKGSRARWILMSHNWGVGYQVFQGLLGQSLSFMLVSGSTLETAGSDLCWRPILIADLHEPSFRLY